TAIVALVQTWVKQGRKIEAEQLGGHVLALRLRLAEMIETKIDATAQKAVDSLAAGRPDGYRALCRQLFADERDTDLAMVGLTLARVCTLGQDALVDNAALLPVIDRSLDQVRDHSEYFCLRGAVLYRMGEFKKAADLLNYYSLFGQATCFGTAYDQFFL